MTDNNLPEKSGLYSPLSRILIILIGAIALIVLVGTIVGYIRGTMERQSSLALIDIGIISALFIVTAICAATMWYFWKKGSDELASPRIRKSQIILQISLVISAIGGVATGAFTDLNGIDPSTLTSDGPVSGSLAAIAIFAWFIVTLTSWIWWRTIDEHEATAYRDASFISFHAYFILMPCWWIAARAGWVPQQNPMLVFILVSLLFTVVWLYKKYF